MQTLSKQQVIDAINRFEPVDCVLEDGSIYIKINEYVPYVCTAIHAGHQLRDELASICLLDDAQRLQEEDPFTDEMIESFPIVLTANDSRYEYDLNRPPESCIYQEAWGKPVWQTPLTEQQTQTSLAKHNSYYQILNALLNVLEQRFSGAMLLDLHSYNWQVREYEQPPVFNIGTSQVNVKRWNSIIKHFEQSLSSIELPNLECQCEQDAVFKGLGYQATFIKQHHKNTLILPLEIKKVFMDEHTGDAYPVVIEQLKQSLYQSVLSTATLFNKRLYKSRLKKADLLPSDLEPVVLKVDKALYRLAKNLETLSYVNPINIQVEKKRFLSRRGYEPQFNYRQLKIDPFDFKEKLYKLPVSQIQDPLIRHLYRKIVDGLATKIELVTHIGTPQFLYNSLRYYGEPTDKDINNALFFLHSSNLPKSEQEQTMLSLDDALAQFRQASTRMGFPCKTQATNRIVAKAMVDNQRRTLLINRTAKFSQFNVNALIEHELGVHMLTTFNAIEQPLKIFELGLPGNTYTQEGLAIYREYCSGNMNIARLKNLSLRVIAVNMMVKGESFNHVYERMRDQFGLSIDEAFSITTRVFRGGGFTKDYLYLSGFRDVVNLAKTRDISSLYLGKTGLEFLDTLDSLRERKIIQKPKYLPDTSHDVDQSQHPILNYLIASIK